MLTWCVCTFAVEKSPGQVDLGIVWQTSSGPHIVLSLNIAGELVIFGVEENVATHKVPELMLLIAKQYIFRNRPGRAM